MTTINSDAAHRRAHPIEGRFRLPTWLAVVLLAVAAVRAGAVVVSAIASTHGDYFASLPGAYVRTVNPTLWESPDMTGAMGYHLETYYHGPVQYLTLYSVAYLNSYEQIARVLLPIYGLVIAVTVAVLIAALKRLAPATSLAVPVVTSTLLFFPLLQSYLQREFEVVILLALTIALWCLVTNRTAAAGVALAYLAWFKYVPLLFLPYVAIRGWVKATIAFLAASAVILGLAHILFDLSLFANNNVPGHAAQVLRVTSYDFREDAAGELVGYGFCAGWFASETTLANVRHGLCSLGARSGWLPPNLVYIALCVLVAGLSLMAYARFQRQGRLPAEQERWRRALELSIITTICACFFFAHYYYLIVLVVPLNVLLARYLADADAAGLALWAVAYVLISAFVVPTSLLSGVLGVDVWARFIKDAWFLYGELMLTALLVIEYVALSGE